MKFYDKDGNEIDISEHGYARQDGQKGIPLDRFNEVNDQRKAAEARLTEMKSQLDQLTEEKNTRDGNLQAIIDDQKTKLAEFEAKGSRLSAIEESLSAHVQARIKDIPKELRSLVPSGMPVDQTLEWLTANQGLLQKPEAFDIGSGLPRDGQKDSTDDSKTLTPEEKATARMFGYSEEEYLKAKADTLEDGKRNEARANILQD